MIIIGIVVLLVVAVFAWYFGYHRQEKLTDVFSLDVRAASPQLVRVGQRTNVLRTSHGERSRRMRARRGGKKYRTQLRDDLWEAERQAVARDVLAAG